jgi:hypothetical protein
MNFQFAVLEPATAATGKFGRLDCLGDAKDIPVELPRLALPASRHGEQDMIQPANAHRFPLCPATIETQSIPHRKNYPRPIATVRCGMVSKRDLRTLHGHKQGASSMMLAQQPNFGSLYQGLC